MEGGAGLTDQHYQPQGVVTWAAEVKKGGHCVQTH
jgi:hypothetical protein